MGVKVGSLGLGMINNGGLFGVSMQLVKIFTIGVFEVNIYGKI